MRTLTAILIVGAITLLASCEEPETATYPISGQLCSPSDPVHQLQSINCVPPG